MSRYALPEPTASPLSPSTTMASHSSLKKTSYLALPLTHPTPKTALIRSPNQHVTSRSPVPENTHKLAMNMHYNSNGGAVVSPVRALASSSSDSRAKARPTTAMPLASTTTLDALIGSASSPQLAPAAQSRHQQRPESAAAVPIAMSSQSPLAAKQPKKAIAPLQAFAAGSESNPHLALRCAGCGAPAEMCFSCFSVFKQQDGAKYKAELVRSVDSLLAKASERAQTRASEVALQWVFNLWRATTRANKRRRMVAESAARRLQLRRQWATWQRFVFQRRVLGAMLYAENQQAATRDKTREVAQLHGDVFELHADANVRAQLQRDELEAQEQRYAELQRSLATKDQELLAVRKELRDARPKVTALEAQVIDPRELERLRVESVDYKKISFQLLGALFQQMDSQVELLSSGEGRYNLAQVFSKDMLQAMEKPENPVFYNPLADLETACACIDVDANSPASSTSSSSSSASSFLAYEASVDRADKLVMQWANWMVGKQPPEWLAAPKMVNFHSSLSDGRVLGVLTKLLHSAMSRVRIKRHAAGAGGPAAISKLEASSVLRENGEDLTEIAMERYLERMRAETSPEKRLELMINTIGQALWLPLGLLNACDILAGDAEFNFAALAYMFCTCTPPVDDTYVATYSDLKQQLGVVKGRWRELKDGEGAAAPGGKHAPTASSSAHVGSGGFPTSGAPQGANSGEDTSLSAKMKLALSHTLELKKRIDLEDARAHEGHVQWLKAARIIMRKCFVSYARLARGQVGVLAKLEAARGDANEAFSKIPKHKIQDLALPYEDFAWEAKLLQTYLITVYCDLARIYRGYASRHSGSGGGTNDTITVADLTQLLNECRVLEGGMTEADLHTILRRMDPKLVRLSHPRGVSDLDVDWPFTMTHLLTPDACADHHQPAPSAAAARVPGGADPHRASQVPRRVRVFALPVSLWVTLTSQCFDWTGRTA